MPIFNTVESIHLKIFGYFEENYSILEFILKFGPNLKEFIEFGTNFNLIQTFLEI